MCCRRRRGPASPPGRPHPGGVRFQASEPKPSSAACRRQRGGHRRRRRRRRRRKNAGLSLGRGRPARGAGPAAGMRVLGSAGAADGARGVCRAGELDGEIVACGCCTVAGRESDGFGDMAPCAEVPDVADGFGTDVKHVRDQDAASCNRVIRRYFRQLRRMWAHSVDCAGGVSI